MKALALSTVRGRTKSRTTESRTGQVADWSIRRLVNSRTTNSRIGQLTHWTTRGLVKSRTSQLADWTNRGLVDSHTGNSRTSQLAHWTTRGLMKSRTSQLADWTNRGLVNSRTVHWTTRGLVNLRTTNSRAGQFADRDAFNFVPSAGIFDVCLPVSSGRVSDGAIEKAYPQNIGIHSRIMFLSRRRAELLGGGNFASPSLSWFVLQNSVRCPRIKLKLVYST